MTYNEAVETIHSFYDLEDNWDSYGAKAFDEEDVLEGLRCLEYVKKHFNWEDINEYLFIAPCVDGATLCEFQDGVFGALIYSRDDSYDDYNIYLDYLNEKN